MTANRYLITFTPVGRFFFGGQRSFAEGFYVPSMKFPQPTTLLGCLRNTILYSNGKTVFNKSGRLKFNKPDEVPDDIAGLTGRSMMDSLFEDRPDFGLIARLSPAFIVKRRLKVGDIVDFLFSAPADVESKDCGLYCFTHAINTAAISSYSGNRLKYAVTSTKNPKKHSPGYLGGEEFWKSYFAKSSCLAYNPEYEEDKIFKDGLSIGIGRDEKRVADEGMFYTKIDYDLSAGYSFGVIAWLGEGHKLTSGTVVIMGGEQSAFRLGIEELKPSPEGLYECHPLMEAVISGNTQVSSVMASANHGEKIIALSPLVCDGLNNDLFEHAIITGIETMRTLIPKTAQQASMKSNSVQMIPGGSVFFPEKAVQCVEKSIMPYTIGYNNVINIKKG